MMGIAIAISLIAIAVALPIVWPHPLRTCKRKGHVWECHFCKRCGAYRHNPPSGSIYKHVHAVAGKEHA